MSPNPSPSGSARSTTATSNAVRRPCARRRAPRPASPAWPATANSPSRSNMKASAWRNDAWSSTSNILVEYSCVWFSMMVTLLFLASGHDATHHLILARRGRERGPATLWPGGRGVWRSAPSSPRPARSARRARRRAPARAGPWTAGLSPSSALSRSKPRPSSDTST